MKIVHAYREANRCADFMAKLGVSSGLGLTSWKDPPPGLGSLLLKDTFWITAGS